jgi:hypothetical protein
MAENDSYFINYLLSSSAALLEILDVINDVQTINSVKLALSHAIALLIKVL